jgi:long-chain acyl-CoA synthetase
MKRKGLTSSFILMTFDLARYNALLPQVIGDLVVAELTAMRPLKFATLDRGQIAASTNWAKDLSLDSLERVTLSAAAAEFFNVYASGREDTLLGVASCERWSEIVSLSQSESARDITFRSSGSTGKPKHFKHSAHWLEQESAHWASVLRQRSAEREISRIVCHVPTHHIYGYLWAVLLSAQAALPVHFASGLDHAAPRVFASDVVIATPRLYQQWAQHGVALKGALGICSTGRLEGTTSDAICDATALDDLWEIYGSSETAGLGVRRRREADYEWLPYVSRIESNDVNDILHVSRVLNDASIVKIALPDSVTYGSAARRFAVGTRHDSITKVFGKRVDLEALGASFATIEGVDAAAVRVMSDGNNGTLKVFLAASDVSLTDEVLFARGKAWLAAHQTEVAPMISSWARGSELPTNAMGKLADW